MGTLASLIKKSISFTVPQMEWLGKKSNELGISIADLVRRCVDKCRED